MQRQQHLFHFCSQFLTLQWSYNESDGEFIRLIKLDLGVAVLANLKTGKKTPAGEVLLQKSGKEGIVAFEIDNQGKILVALITGVLVFIGGKEISIKESLEGGRIWSIGRVGDYWIVVGYSKIKKINIYFLISTKTQQLCATFHHKIRKIDFEVRSMHIIRRGLVHYIISLRSIRVYDVLKLDVDSFEVVRSEIELADDITTKGYESWIYGCMIREEESDILFFGRGRWIRASKIGMT